MIAALRSRNVWRGMTNLLKSNNLTRSGKQNSDSITFIYAYDINYSNYSNNAAISIINDTRKMHLANTCKTISTLNCFSLLEVINYLYGDDELSSSQDREQMRHSIH